MFTIQMAQHDIAATQRGWRGPDTVEQDEKIEKKDDPQRRIRALELELALVRSQQ